MLRSLVLAAIGLLLATASARAGPIFEILGLGSAGYNASTSWGISGTGGGRIDGQLVLRDDFVLPGSGGSTALAPTDIVSLTYSHTDPNPSDTALVIPVFSFSATAGQILGVSGFVAESGGGYILQPGFFSIQTSVELSIFGNAGGGNVGIFQGDARLANTVLELVDTTAPPPTATIRLIQDSQQPGVWTLTGFTATSVPEPASLLVLAGPLAWMTVRRRRRRG